MQRPGLGESAADDRASRRVHLVLASRRAPAAPAPTRSRRRRPRPRSRARRGSRARRWPRGSRRPQGWSARSPPRRRSSPSPRRRCLASRTCSSAQGASTSQGSASSSSFVIASPGAKSASGPPAALVRERGRDVEAALVEDARREESEIAITFAPAAAANFANTRADVAEPLDRDPQPLEREALRCQASPGGRRRRRGRSPPRGRASRRRRAACR